MIELSGAKPTSKAVYLSFKENPRHRARMTSKEMKPLRLFTPQAN
jgi:hypothetical protein